LSEKKKRGRPAGWTKGYSESKPIHSIRASEAEWQLIKKFADFVKAQGIAKAEKLLAGV